MSSAGSLCKVLHSRALGSCRAQAGSPPWLQEADSAPQRIVALLPLPSLSVLPAGLSEFAVEGTVVSVVSQEVPPGMPERRVNGCRFNHIQGDPSSWKSFQKAGMAEADSILLGGWGHLSCPSSLCFSGCCAAA